MLFPPKEVSSLGVPTRETMWVPLLNAILLAFVASGYAVSTEGGESHGSFEPTDHILFTILPKKMTKLSL